MCNVSKYISRALSSEEENGCMRTAFVLITHHSFIATLCTERATEWCISKLIRDFGAY